MTSAAPAVTEGDGDRCRCGRNCSAASVVRPEAVWRIASRLAEGNERHQAARTALRAFARSIDEVALRSRWPPIPSHRAGRDRRSTASTAARLGARSANLGQTAHYSQAIAHFVDRRSRSRSGGVAKTARRRLPHRSLITRRRGLPSPNRDRRAAPYTSGASGITSRKNGAARRSKLRDAHRWPTCTSEL